MAIEKSSLEEKIAGMKLQLVQLQANTNAVAGAIQFAEQLLEEASKEASSVEDNKE